MIAEGDRIRLPESVKKYGQMERRDCPLESPVSLISLTIPVFENI